MAPQSLGFACDSYGKSNLAKNRPNLAPWWSKFWQIQKSDSFTASGIYVQYEIDISNTY